MTSCHLCFTTRKTKCTQWRNCPSCSSGSPHIDFKFIHSYSSKLYFTFNSISNMYVISAEVNSAVSSALSPSMWTPISCNCIIAHLCHTNATTMEFVRYTKSLQLCWNTPTSVSFNWQIVQKGCSNMYTKLQVIYVVLYVYYKGLLFKILFALLNLAGIS